MSTFDILLLVADLRTTPDVAPALDIASKLVDGANPIELAAPDGPVTIAIRNDVIPRLIDWLSADDNVVDLPTKINAATLLNRIATMSATQASAIAADHCVRVVHLLDTVMWAMQRTELAPSIADPEDRAERQLRSNRDQISTGDVQPCRNELIVQLVQCLSRSVSQGIAFSIRMETQPACFDALFEVVATTGADLSTAAMELAMLFISSEPSPKAPLIVSSRSTSALAIIADKHPSMAVPVITILNRLGDSIEQILHDDASPCIRAVLHSLASLHHFALLSSSVDYIGIVAQLSFFAPNVAIPRATTLHTTEAALAVATLDRISSFARPASATVTVYRVLQRFIELVDARNADPSSHAFQNALLSLARSSSSSSSTSIPGKVALLHIWTLTPLPSTAALATGADFVVEELRDGATSPGYVDAVARVAGRLGAALAAAQHVKALVSVAFDEERSRDVRLVAARVLQGVAGASPNVLIDSAFLDAVMDTDWAPFDNRHDPEWRSVTLGVAGSVVRAAGPEANLPNGPRLTAVLLSSLAKAANVAVMRVVDALLDSSVYLAAVSSPTGPFYSQQAVLGVLVQIGKRTDDDGISLGVAIADRLIGDDVTLEDLIAGPNGVRVIAEICRICSKVAVGDRIARPAASSLTMSALVHRALVFADRVGKVQDVVDGDDNVMMTAFYGALIENVTRLARKAALAPVDATHWATVISQTAALWVLSKATTVRPDADIAGMIRVALSLSGGGRTDLPAIASALIADIKDGGLIADSRDLLATITQVLPDASVADDDSLVLLCIGLGRMAVSSATRMAMIRTRTVPVLIRLLNPQQREGDARRPAHHRAISDLMRVLNPVQGELAHATDQVATRAWYARTGLLSMSTRKSGFLVGPPHAEPVDAMTSVGHCRDLLTRSGNASATALDRRDDDCRLSMQDWIDAEYDLLLEEGRPPPP